MIPKITFIHHNLPTWSTLPSSPGLRDLAASLRLVNWDWISEAEREAILSELCELI